MERVPESTPLDRRQLGETGIEVSRLGLGSGGPSQFGQQRIGADPPDRILEKSINLGINLVDTAPGYGESEAMLGRAIAQHGFREGLVLSSKFNPFRAGVIAGEASLRASLERSLERLGSDYLDLYFIHGLPFSHADEILDRFWPAMEEVKAANLVRSIGVSERYGTPGAHDAIRRALRMDSIDMIMVGYNILSPLAARILIEEAAAANIGVIGMCAVRGILSEPARLEALLSRWKREGLLEKSRLPESGPLDWLLDEAESITEAAYRFVVSLDGVDSVLTGSASVSHIEENAAAVSKGRLRNETALRLRQLFEAVGRSADFRDLEE